MDAPPIFYFQRILNQASIGEKIMELLKLNIEAKISRETRGKRKEKGIESWALGT